MMVRVWYRKYDVRMGDKDTLLNPQVIFVDAVTEEEAHHKLKEMKLSYGYNAGPLLDHYEILDELEAAVLDVVERE